MPEEKEKNYGFVKGNTNGVKSGNTGGHSSKAVKAVRIAQVYDMIMNGHDGAELVAEIRLKYSVGDWTARSYMAKAYELLEKQTITHATETKLDIQLARIHYIYQQAIAAKRYAEALNCLKELGKYQHIDPLVEAKTRKEVSENSFQINIGLIGQLPDSGSVVKQLVATTDTTPPQQIIDVATIGDTAQIGS